MFVLYTWKLWYEYFTPAFWLYNNLSEFTALEHVSKLTQKYNLFMSMTGK